MKRAALAFLLACGAHGADVVVLDGAGVEFMHDALARIACPFDRAAAPGANHRIAILCGKDVRADAKGVAKFLEEGGRVLAVGGGAKWMLDAGLFEARGYYPSGTTEHFATFAGYHRITACYPLAKPADNCLTGVPSLLRATGGPLMRLGPRATSVLSAGEPFSIAAFQRVGKGPALLAGADPQGGNEVLALGGKPVPKRGDLLGTDPLLAGALAWLRDPGCNLIPNSGFEQSIDGNGERSRWDFILANGGTFEWSHADAPEGTTFLKITGAKPDSRAVAAIHRPIIVEGGAVYRFSCRQRSTAAWSLDVRRFRSATEVETKVAPQTIAVPAASEWQRFETTVAVPDGASLLGLVLRVQGAGTLEVDELTLTRLP